MPEEVGGGGPVYNSESLKQIVYAPWSISADLSRSHAFGIGRPRLHGPLPPEVSADMVGYESEAAFSRAFKKAVGVAPATWRRSHS